MAMAASRGWRRRHRRSWVAWGTLGALVWAHPLGAWAAPGLEPRPDGATIVRLTQRPCVIVEAEDPPPAFVSRNKAECESINRRTLAQRHLEVLRLKAGRYVFRVTNEDVPYELGFWLRGRGTGRLTLPSVSGGGLEPGATRDYEIDLRRGTYLYSCPLNPTPDYTLIVK